jgi:protoheme IX farnesyltransferase
MLPVTHGIPLTKVCILLYTILMIITTIFPYITGMSGISYLVCAIGLGIGFLYYAIRLLFTNDRKVAFATFTYSIVYLMALFLGFLFDHYLFRSVDIFS